MNFTAYNILSRDEAIDEGLESDCLFGTQWVVARVCGYLATSPSGRGVGDIHWMADRVVSQHVFRSGAERSRAALYEAENTPADLRPSIMDFEFRGSPNLYAIKYRIEDCVRGWARRRYWPVRRALIRLRRQVWRG